MKAVTTARFREERRALMRTVASAAGLVLVGFLPEASPGEERTGSDREEDGEALVTPGEDLMQEHGVIERILLLYDEAVRRIEHGEELDLAVLASAAGIIRHFVEDYHEKLEEQFVFPRMKSAHRETELVAVLERQHRRGREVTDEVVRLCGRIAATTELADLLRAFERMYRPHAAREATVLFPAFREVVGRGAYRELGEQFEEREHEQLGEGGFEGAVAQVAQLEKALGIADLAQFTVP
jgi:hemerythrin-like domain-containing protein